LIGSRPAAEAAAVTARPTGPETTPDTVCSTRIPARVRGLASRNIRGRTSGAASTKGLIRC